MWQEWPIVFAALMFIIALGSFYLNSAGRFLSLREHETNNEFIKRELDILSHRLDVIEQTRPTTGELEAKISNILKNNKGIVCPQDMKR